MNRREFLKQMGLLSLTLLLSPLETGLARAQDGLSRSGRQASPIDKPTKTKRLVVVFLRGAVDGLNIVIPSAENYYYDARPNIAIPEPGKPDGALVLNRQFGLHPALSPLLPFW